MNFLSERIDEDGNVYHKFKVGNGTVETFVRKEYTQEELDAKRIQEIFAELKQVNSDIENYTLVGDTDKVAELETQKQALIDEYNTLKG